jgi:mono/diheme cytochrome c family protein
VKRIKSATLLLVAIGGAASSGAACSAAPTDPVGTSGQAATTACAPPWSVERGIKQAQFDAYLAQNANGFESFKNAALGNLGVPMVMFRLFPILFPQYWGPPSMNFAPVGFAQDPYEQRVLPLGLGYAGSTPAVTTPAGPVNVNVVTLTCMGCHGGRVQGPDGIVRTIPGAPNTQFDGFRTAVYATVNDPGYTAAAFRAALAAEPAGWVYGDPSLLAQETLERDIFMAPGGAEGMLAQLQEGSNFFATRFEETLGTYTYGLTPNAPNPAGPTPGYLDAIGAGITIVVDPTVLTPAQVQAALPPAPAMIDIMSVWMQNARPAAQWDGSIEDHLHRNLAAEFGVIGSPTNVNMRNADVTTLFTAAMPSPPYPYDVDDAAAAEGSVLFGQYCASCHHDGNPTIFPPAVTGTDQNRAIIWTPYSVAALQDVLREACTDPVTCNPGGVPLTNAQIVNPTGGYMALPLSGIWARAPYLHNGSVPTLAALLTNKRPAQFYRGNITYDTVNVGFVSTAAVTPFAALYDTTLSGNSNGGHNTPEFLGPIDWAQQPEKLHAMLEYLKTL